MILRIIFCLVISLTSFLQGWCQQTSTIILDDQFMVIGDPNFQDRKNTYSSVMVYEKVGNDWQQLEKIKDPGSEGSAVFGQHIIIYGRELLISDEDNNKIYRYFFRKNKAYLRDIYTPSDHKEVGFGSIITLVGNHLFIGSSRRIGLSGKRKGLIHVYTINDDGIYPLQTIETVDPNGNNITRLSDHQILISASVKDHSLYQYQLSSVTGKWEMVEVLKSKEDSKTAVERLQLTANDHFLFIRTTQTSDERIIPIIKIYDHQKSLQVPVQTLLPPRGLIDTTFAYTMTASSNKFYVCYKQKDYSSGILVYDLDCSNQWQPVQRITPENGQEQGNFSIAANDHFLGIGTQRSLFKAYYDMEALADGKVRIYQYQPDSTQIAFLKITRENFYISPSGKKHLYSHRFYDTITNQKGCDSIIDIDLTITYLNSNGIQDTTRLSKSLEIDKEIRPVEILDTVLIESAIIKLGFYDHGAFDHDSISIQLNGEWVLLSEEVTKEQKLLFLKANKGFNHLVFFAENEGEEAPNTVAILIYNEQNEILQKKVVNTSLKGNVALIFHKR